MSDQNPRYGFGNPKCVSHSFLLQSLPSSTTSDTSGVQRPTDCLWSGWRRWERGLNCPEHDPQTLPWNPDRRQLISELRHWQVNGEKLSSKDKSCLSTMTDEILNLNLNEQGSVVDRPLKRLVVRSRQRRCLSSRSSRSFQGAGLSPSQGKAKLEVTALAKDRRFWGQDQRLQDK